MNEVTIIVTSRKTGDNYEARSYPDSDKNNDGVVELYRVPVYEIDISSGANKKTWTAVRFMPYWNDPKTPDTHYKTKGFVNSGLHKHPKQIVSLYLPNYGTQNRYSPFRGAIQIRNSFLIHAGPSDLKDIGWGSAGCVEIIGDFNQFKKDIRDLAGMSSMSDPGIAISKLVQNRKLLVQLEYAAPPNFNKTLVSP